MGAPGTRNGAPGKGGCCFGASCAHGRGQVGDCKGSRSVRLLERCALLVPNPATAGLWCSVLQEGQLLRKAIGWVAENGLGISSDQVMPEAFRPLQEDAFEFGGPGQLVLFGNGILRNPPLDSGHAPCSELAMDLFAEDAHKK